MKIRETGCSLSGGCPWCGWRLGNNSIFGDGEAKINESACFLKNLFWPYGADQIKCGVMWRNMTAKEKIRLMSKFVKSQNLAARPSWVIGASHSPDGWKSTQMPPFWSTRVLAIGDLLSANGKARLSFGLEPDQLVQHGSRSWGHCHSGSDFDYLQTSMRQLSCRATVTQTRMYNLLSTPFPEKSVCKKYVTNWSSKTQSNFAPGFHGQSKMNTICTKSKEKIHIAT